MLCLYCSVWVNLMANFMKSNSTTYNTLKQYDLKHIVCSFPLNPSHQLLMYVCITEKLHSVALIIFHYKNSMKGSNAERLKSILYTFWVLYIWWCDLLQYLFLESQMNPRTIMKSLEHKKEILCVRNTECIASTVFNSLPSLLIRVLNSSNCASEWCVFIQSSSPLISSNRHPIASTIPFRIANKFHTWY